MATESDTVGAHRRRYVIASPIPRVAVLIPCHNEAVAIPTVVAGFRAALPDATIYVYDNNSTDGTIAGAAAAS